MRVRQHKSCSLPPALARLGTSLKTAPLCGEHSRLRKMVHQLICMKSIPSCLSSPGPDSCRGRVGEMNGMDENQEWGPTALFVISIPSPWSLDHSASIVLGLSNISFSKNSYRLPSTSRWTFATSSPVSALIVAYSMSVPYRLLRISAVLLYCCSDQTPLTNVLAANRLPGYQQNFKHTTALSS